MPGQPLQVPDPDAGPAAETRPAPDVPDFALSPYVVQPGDTLSGIAAEQGIPLALVLALNPDQAPDLLRAGAVLQVPAAGVPPPRDAEAAAGRWRLSAYVVQPGDTLWDIATAHAIPLALLEQLNPTTESGTLRVGDRLRVPITDVDAAQADTAHILDYAVQPGDTASAIAATHGIALADLATANPDRDLDQIAVGEVLRVPLAGTSVGAPAPAVGRPVLLNPVGGRETMVRRWGAPNGPYGLHRAIDFFVPAGTLVVAPLGGVIGAAGPVADAVCETRAIAIDDDGGHRVWILHFEGLFVEPGQAVAAGDPLGTVRAALDDPCITGLPDHTHLELHRPREGGGFESVDPEPFLLAPLSVPDCLPPPEPVPPFSELDELLGLF